jgi:hypothetical protein
MTESEWLECTDPTPMLEFLIGPATLTPKRSFDIEIMCQEFLHQYTNDRKLRLFALACCRAIWHRLRDERSRATLEVAERHAAREATTEELRAAAVAAQAAWEAADWKTSGAAEAVWEAAWEADGATSKATSEAVHAAMRVAGLTAGASVERSQEDCWAAWVVESEKETHSEQATLLRDIIGSPSARLPSTLAGSPPQ